MKVRKRYSKDFKDLVISQIRDGISVAELARRYEISDKTIQQWKTNTMPINPDDRGRKVSLQTFKRLQKENDRLKQEVYILKKAIRYVEGID